VRASWSRLKFPRTPVALDVLASGFYLNSIVLLKTGLVTRPGRGFNSFAKPQRARIAALHSWGLPANSLEVRAGIMIFLDHRDER
jgi:hypothetical protein